LASIKIRLIIHVPVSPILFLFLFYFILLKKNEEKLVKLRGMEEEREPELQRGRCISSPSKNAD
jgi:hypothetical protein